MDNQPIRKIELLPSDGVRKRTDTSGHATAELINRLQKRSISEGASDNKSEN